MRSAHGFTLVEVMIALVILATVLTLGSGSVQRSAVTLGDLEERLLAHWAAENALVEQLLDASAAGAAAVAEPVERRTTVTQYGAAFLVASRLVPGVDAAPGSLRVEVAARARPADIITRIEIPVAARP